MTVVHTWLIKGKQAVVKQIALSKDSEVVRNRQISNLDASFRFLKDFKHPNVVQHCGFQAFLPGSGVSYYRIVMDYCEGPQLIS